MYYLYVTMIKHHIDLEKTYIVFFGGRKGHERFCIRYCRNRNQIFLNMYLVYFEYVIYTYKDTLEYFSKGIC